MQKKLLEKPNVTMKWNQQLDEVLGDARASMRMRIRDVHTGPSEKIEVQGVFIAIGHTPNTALFEGQRKWKGGYIVTRGGRSGARPPPA